MLKILTFATLATFSQDFPPYKFQMTPLIGFCKRRKDSVEFYSFWARADRSYTPIEVYLNYSNLLKVFVTYFNEKCRKILHSDTVPYLSLGELIGADFLTGNINKDRDNSLMVRKYLREIGLGKEIDRVDSLSSREKECVRLLLRGKSAKETAGILNLSFRTVEHYLENVKGKLRCQYKSGIFSASEKFNELGLL